MTTHAEVERKFEFDEDFQTKIAACVVRSTEFNKGTFGLIKPEYFQNYAESVVVNLALMYYAKYKFMPSLTILRQLANKQVDRKVIKKENIEDVLECAEMLTKSDISDMPYIIEEVAIFAKHAAIENAFMASVDLLEKRDFDKIEKRLSEAFRVGAVSNIQSYNFFGKEEIEKRERIRTEKLAGVTAGNALSTGVKELDNLLYHKGWARKEFYLFMGPPKSGKSTALAYFAKNLSMQGNNVLFVTLEVSTGITSDRIDASITGVPMKMLERKSIEVRDKLSEYMLSGKMGELCIEEHPTGTLTPNDLELLMDHYLREGIKFDAVVVDYADIMAPNIRTDSPIENSRTIYVDLRAIAQKHDVVMISATQTNREGAKAAVAKMEHVAEDFNKIRIPDLVISINATEEERSEGVARLFFVASRNQESGFSIIIQQRLEAMQFLIKVLSIE